MKVVNLRNSKYDVYIGRGGKWGNPFVIGKDGNRDDVIRKYRVYLNSNVDLLSSLYELEGKVLGCYCKPLDCHGDVLIEFVKSFRDS
jgi:predicted glycosyltransferase involved in capsule biosynthesis